MSLNRRGVYVPQATYCSIIPPIVSVSDLLFHHYFYHSLLKGNGNSFTRHNLTIH